MASIIFPEKRQLRAGPRLMQILRVLNRHKFLGALRGRNHWPTPKEVRETFEELGLTFLKLGQVLALRRDLLPDAYINELEQLLDQLPAQDFRSVRARIEYELGAPLAKLFSSFNEAPLAAATIAQVHEATTMDGRHVAVKVQRPKLEKMIATDIAALNYLVVLGENLFPRLRALDLSVLVSEFAASLSRETDFQHEARSILLFRAALADIPELWIPDVVAEYSTATVLTMEFSAGERVDLYAIEHPEAMPKAIGTLVRVMLQTIFEEGMFHGDPHSGNVFVLSDGRLCLLDFGMTGELDEQMRESLTHLLEAIINKDARAATDSYLDMAISSEKVNNSALMVDMKAIIQEVHRNELADVSIGNTFAALLRAGSRHGIHNPGEFFLLTRAFVIMESMMRKLDPQFDFMGAFREEIKRLTTQHFSLNQIKDKTTKFARDLERLLGSAPDDTRRVLRRIAEGNLGRLQAPSIEALGGRAVRSVKLLTQTMAASAFMLSGAMMINAPRDMGWHHTLGQVMVTIGVFGMIFIGISSLFRYKGRGQDQR